MPHVLVTGASAGIGEAIVRRFARDGFGVSLVARREEKLREVAGSVDAETFVRPADLSDTSVIGTLIEDVEAALGPIDVLVNNAGIQYVEPTAGVSAERIETIFTVNVTAPMILQNAVLPRMIERRSGAIVNIASMAAITPTPGMAHYNGTKAALAATSESLRAELDSKGVHVLTVYPGPVKSEMEAAAREAFPDGASVDKLPTGTPGGLADLIFEGVRKKKARVVYPKVYGLTRYFRVTSEWLTRTFTPSLESGEG